GIENGCSWQGCRPPADPRSVASPLPLRGMPMSTRKTESPRLPHPAGGALQGHLSHSGQPSEWAVVYVHGFASNSSGEQSKVVEAACAARGWTYASFDFRGHGQSTGSLLDL